MQWKGFFKLLFFILYLSSNRLFLLVFHKSLILGTQNKLNL